MSEQLYVIMPVKDAIDMATRSIMAIVESGWSVCVYDDNSLPENRVALDRLAVAHEAIAVVHVGDHTDHPSPNYRWVLQHARSEALTRGAHLVIVESDVQVRPNTLARLASEAETADDIGMVAAITHDADDLINFPYLYAKGKMERKYPQQTVATKKRFSFCCTLLSINLLAKADFALLDSKKNWYDVFISHWSVRLGFRNLLMLGNAVLHTPHASRPWKLLKYTNPWLYYWRKITRRLDRI